MVASATRAEVRLKTAKTGGEGDSGGMDSGGRTGRKAGLQHAYRQALRVGEFQEEMEGDRICPSMTPLSLSVRLSVCVREVSPEVLGIEQSYFVHSIVIFYQVCVSLQVNKLLIIYW